MDDSPPVAIVEQVPEAITSPAAGVALIDFGRVAFGNLLVHPPSGFTGEVTVHLGESTRDGRIDRTPPGSVRYARITVHLEGKPVVVAASPDARNTGHPAAIRTPPEWGVLLPFRWVEIEGWPGGLTASSIVRRAAFSTTWDEQASAFACSDPMVNRIWELCRYSIKATTFAGIYVDGDRERIPYEADAFINQMCHYAVDRDTAMARRTFDFLIEHPTWPTEWASHLIFMAYADWMHTGDRAWLASCFDRLLPKLLPERTRSDGLIASDEGHIAKGDLVDWPDGERDGFVFTSLNTVVNAFHLRTLTLMREMALSIDRPGEADALAVQHASARMAFQHACFDPASGRYRDGEGTGHASLHANLFPQAFGLVPEEQRDDIADWLVQRGMACSVYAAFYLLDGLFEQERAGDALALMTAPGDRSWRHMVESGTTITWEAWDQRYKPNQDWNHAWGAAPAYLLPRHVVGVRPLEPGWKNTLIRPGVGQLAWAEGRVPTPRGTIHVRWENGAVFRLKLSLPGDMTAWLELPASAESTGVWRDGEVVPARRIGSRWRVDEAARGEQVWEVL